MASPVEVTMVLCTAALSDSTTGTLSMLGAGWSITGSPTGQQAIALIIKVPWDRANVKLDVTIKLLSADGQSVSLPGPAGAQRVEAIAELEVGRPPGIAHGSYLDASLAVNFPPLPLPPGRYQWRSEVAQTVRTESFTVQDSKNLAE